MSRSVGVWIRKTLRVLRVPKPPTLVDIPDQIAGPGRVQKIPRIVYQTAESRLVHPTHAKSIAEFRRLNSNLAVELFDRDARDRYMHATWGNHPIAGIYSRAVLGQMKADIFRYCIVFDRGGYYFDFNKGCRAAITEMHPANAEGLVSYERNPELLFPEERLASQLQNPFNLVLQWAFGFHAGHPLLRLVINRIVEIEPFFCNRVFRYPKQALLTMSGPGVFTSAFREYVRQEGIGTIAEAGEDFNGEGIVRLRGSKFLAKSAEYYGNLHDAPIVVSEK